MGDYIDIGGINTWYDEQGTGDPLVLLHGGLCTNETWGAQLPVFAERFRVVWFDPPGTGLSQRDRYRFSSFVMAIVTSAPFQMKTKAQE